MSMCRQCGMLWHMPDIIGHERVLEFFDKVLANETLSHAYCFIGSEMIGKKTVARHLAALLLKTSPEKLETHPDWHFVEQIANEKTGKMNRDISIEQLRELREALSRRSFLGGYSVTVIDEADKMNAAAANALLKTLEEPKGKTVLFLTTNNEQFLPATILSRCQKIYFQAVPKNVIQKAIEEKIEIRAEEMARLSLGRPGQVLKWQADPAEYEAHKREILRFVSLPKKSFHEKIAAVEDLFGDKTDHIVARAKLYDILNLWLLLLRDWLLNGMGRPLERVHRVDMPKTVATDQILRMEQTVRQALSLLNRNVHPRLLVESILLEIP